MGGIKRTKHDSIFSDCVRERASWTCENCGKHYPIGHRRGLECAHIYGRANKTVRWEPMNAVALCTSCHFYFGGNPLDFKHWLTEEKGESYLDILNEKRNSVIKRSKSDLEDLHKHYKNEFRIMLEERAKGVTGWLEFTGYD